MVVAAAALRRLGLAERATELLDPSVMLPQVGQGALGVECRADDHATAELLATIDDVRARRAVDAERGFLAVLAGGCDVPVAAYATEEPNGTLTIEGLLASSDGRIVLRARKHGPAGDPAGLGAALANYLLDDAGGRLLLEDLDPVAGLFGQAPGTARGRSQPDGQGRPGGSGQAAGQGRPKGSGQAAGRAPAGG